MVLCELCGKNASEYEMAIRRISNAKPKWKEGVVPFQWATRFGCCSFCMPYFKQLQTIKKETKTTSLLVKGQTTAL